jgi:hypothetical protein
MKKERSHHWRWMRAGGDIFYSRSRDSVTGQS